VAPVDRLKVTLLVDNETPGEGLVGEHGFSAILETDRGTVLFDAGASSDAAVRNAAALGVDLAPVGAIALSHGHYDHTGGLAAVLEAAPEAVLYVHPQIAAKRWGHRLGFKKSIGMSGDNLKAAEARGMKRVTEPLLLPQGVMLSGSIPGPPSPTEKNFTVEIDGERAPDRFVDEMFVLAETRAGVFLLTGCCHRGLANTLNHAQRLAGGKPITTVVGGLHLARLSKAELDASVAALQSAGSTEVIAGHCTGKRAIAYLAQYASLHVDTFHVGFTREW